jgi:hypothetical protein
MITKLHLRNFKGVQRGEVPLSRVTVLVGPNGSGKTTVLEALFLAHGLSQPVVGNLAAWEVLSEIHRTLGSAGLLHLLHRYSGKAAALYDAQEGRRAVLLRRAGASLEVFYLAKAPGSAEELMELEPSAVAAGAREEYGPAPQAGGAKAQFLKAFFFKHGMRERVLSELYTAWADVVLSGATRRVAQRVSKACEEAYLDLLAEPFVGGAPALFAYRDDGYRVRLGDLGDGVADAAAAMLAVEVAKPQLLLWDCVEAFMHPRALQVLALWFSELAERGVQVVVSTHSLDAALLVAELCEGASFVRLSLAKGALSATSYTAEDLEELRGRGLDIRV